MSKSVLTKKQDLEVRKEEILKELKYYERRIEDAQGILKSSSLYDDDSSDSEVEFTIDTGTSITELKAQEDKLRTCLHATQELTGLHILNSEINIVDAPTLDSEPAVSGKGLWREVAAECRIDLISFSIAFYVHQPSALFGAPSFRGLCVVLRKPVHQRELDGSVLPRLAAPSAAIRVLQSYALAHRSRRSSLAKLAERYGETLFMEIMPQGGYLLRCADVLQVSWSLQNKGSPVAPFHHKMTFDLEYMDETYVKTITQVHRQLSNPALQTDERTHLLAQIIDTCLEARKQARPEVTMGSDMESQSSKRHHTSDQESDNPAADNEIMGPPKSLPKKSKAKGKENTDSNKFDSRKRPSDTKNEADAKKTKPNKNNANTKISENKLNSNVTNENTNLVKSIDELADKESYGSNLAISIANNNDILTTITNKESSSIVSNQKQVSTKVISSGKNANNKDKNSNDTNPKSFMTQNQNAKASTDKEQQKSKKLKSSVNNKKLLKQSETNDKQMRNFNAQKEQQAKEKSAKTSDKDKIQNENLTSDKTELKGDKDPVSINNEIEKLHSLANTNKKTTQYKITTEKTNHKNAQQTGKISDKVPTLSERFASKQKPKESSNLPKSLENVKKTNAKQSNDENLTRNKRDFSNKQIDINNVPKNNTKPKSSVSNVSFHTNESNTDKNQINNNSDNNKQTQFALKSSIHNKMKLNNQKLRKSYMTQPVSKNDPKKTSKIPQKKRLSVKKRPLRISPSKSCPGEKTTKHVDDDSGQLQDFCTQL